MPTTLKALLVAKVVDELGVWTLCRAYALIDSEASLSTIRGRFGEWVSALDAVTAGQIVDASYEVYPDLPALKSSPAAGSRVCETAVICFRGPASARRDAIAVPALASSLLSGGLVVTASGPVADLIALEESGGPDLQFSTSSFDGPLTYRDAFRVLGNTTARLIGTR